MKTLILSFLATSLAIVMPVQADLNNTGNLFDKFKSVSAQYGKRGRALDAIISKAFSSKDNFWIRKDYSEQEDETWTSYSPEYANNKYPGRNFTLSEYNYTKYKDYNILLCISYVKGWLKSFDSYSQEYINKSGELIKRTIEYKLNTLSENENNICFESILYEVSQKCLKNKTTTDLFGNEKEGELIPQGEPKIEPERYTIYWVENLGNGKFRQYSYYMREQIATEEEKTFLVELFKKMEEQIKKIPS